MGIKDRVKGAKTKGGDAFARLKQKWSRSSSQIEASNTSGGDGKEEGEKESILGKIGKSIKGIGKKKEKKKKEEKTEKEEEEPEEEKKKRVGFQTEGIRKKIVGIVASGIIMAGAALGGFIYFPEFGQLVLIVCAITMAFIVISMFIKGVGGYLFLGFIAVVILVSWQLGFVDPIAIKDLIIEYATPGIAFAEDTWYTTQCLLQDPTNFDACMKAREEKEEEKLTKLGPIETLELNWGRKVDGTYDYDLPEQNLPYNLEITLVNKNDKIYTINVSDIKASTKSDDTEIYGSYYKMYEEYTLDPEEELSVTIRFGNIGECTGSKNFKVNVTTEQNSGGWSDFGIAPSDEDEHRKFVHGFDPDITVEPGPLNIYVFTYPYGIDAKSFKDVYDEPFQVIIKIQNNLKSGTANVSELYLIQEFEVPKAPNKLFDIESGTCDLTSGREVIVKSSYPDCIIEEGAPDSFGERPCYCSEGCPDGKRELGSGFSCDVYTPSDCISESEISELLQKNPADEKCSGSNHNCIRFSFTNPLILKPDKKITISCNATINRIPESEYTDQIRVYANFEYIQEWSKSIVCAT